ncbi:MAG: GH3 auxin-responsive promoter family protein [Planctomycetaceae bacterium]
MTPIVSTVARLWTLQQALRELGQFQAELRRPRETQHRVLIEQLRREAETGFGRDHRFREIRSVADFRRQVPISDYDSHFPYIDRVLQGDVTALFQHDRVVMFAMTSGTTRARKFIPVTDRVLDQTRKMWRVWGLQAFTEHRDLFGHARLALASDWDECRSPSNMPCGSISGMTAQMQNWVVREGYVLPPEAGKIHEIEAKYYLAWRLGIERSVGMMISPNPSTLLNLARFGTAHADSLLRDLFDGRLSPEITLPDDLRKSLTGRLRPQRLRARLLSAVARRTGGLRPRDVWPELGLLGCWTGGSMTAYLQSFPEQFGSAAVRDIGLIASEGRMTLPMADGTSSGALEVGSGFFEFIPVGEIDSPQPTVLEAHELQEGAEYYILLTNASGLYRYNIQDVVRCTGWQDQTPRLAFLRKGAGIANITGEKLAEHQVVEAVAAALAEGRRTLQAFSLAPCWDETQPFYGLFLEERDLVGADATLRLTSAIDAGLCEANMEYAAKRQSARLGAVQAISLPDGFWQRWDLCRLRERGGSPEQYKHPCLIADFEFAEQHRPRVHST